VVIDDLSTGIAERVQGLHLVEASLLDGPSRLAAVLTEHEVSGIVHLAAKKAVPESVDRPLYYYEQNVTGTIALLRAAVQAGVHHILYSSSAAVYGETAAGRIDEGHPTSPTNPYGETKLAAEWLVRRTAEAHGMSWTALRYFNVAGAADGRLADRGVFNLLPIVLRRVDEGRPVSVFGGDWPTPDGSCVRDYVHVEDVADAHRAAVDALDAEQLRAGIFNVGRGEGVSVLEYAVRGRANGWPSGGPSDRCPPSRRPSHRRGRRIGNRGRPEVDGRARHPRHRDQRLAGPAQLPRWVMLGTVIIRHSARTVTRPWAQVPEREFD